MSPRLPCAVLVLVLLSGCLATTTSDEFRPSTEQIVVKEGERVVILGRRDAGHYETDRDFIECVGSKIESRDITVFPEQEFIDAIYPWFEPRTAPKRLARLRWLMDRSEIKKTVKHHRIRYLVWMDGSTETRNSSGSMSCSIGPGGGGCFGFAKWDKTSAYEAIIWDLNNLTEKGRIRVDSEGTSYLIGVVAPIPLLTPVKSDACSSLGDQLKDFFIKEEV
jgi:hypothetical protein